MEVNIELNTSSHTTSLKDYIYSGVINGWLAHVGGTSCGHTLGERISMCGGVFRERHHLGLYRLNTFSDIVVFYMDLSYLL